jgi:hypothetical protein
LYRVVIDHQRTGVGIAGPALKWLAKAYCLTELKYLEDELPAFSNGWFDGFKKQHNLHGYRMHGEASSMLNIDQNTIDVQMNQIKEKLQGYETRDIFNFDETGLYFSRSPTRTISSEPVAGNKQDKRRITIGLLCNADGSFRMNPCIIGKFNKPGCFEGKTGNIISDSTIF